MERPHILIIPPWFDIDFQHHFSKSYHRWARDLAEKNNAEVGLLYGEFNTGWRHREWFQKEDAGYNYLGIKSWGLPKAGPGWWRWLHQYRSAYLEYERKYGRPTVLHGFSLLGLIAAWSIHRYHHIPYVYTEVLGSFISEGVARRLVRKAHTPASLASLICGISPEMVVALHRNFGVDATLIPLYIDVDQFDPAPLPVWPPKILSIGSPALTKGMDILVEAMGIVIKSWTDAHLTIVCEPRDVKFLEGLIRKYQLDTNVSLAGPVPHEEIPGLLKQSNLLVSASREESFGYTMVEALAAGRPVVASSSPGARYIVDEGQGRIVAFSGGSGGVAPVELGREMVNVLNDMEDFVPEELHENVRDRFGKEKILDQWMDIYDGISNKPYP